MRANSCTLVFSLCLCGAVTAEQYTAQAETNAIATSGGTALDEIRASAEKGDVNAQFLLGFRYATADGVTQNFEGIRVSNRV